MEDRFEVLKKQILEDKEIKHFIKINKIDDESVMRNLSLFHQHYADISICRKCLGKKLCKMDPFQYQSEIIYINANVQRKYKPCPYLDLYDSDLLEIMFFPQTIDSQELFYPEERDVVYSAMTKFVDNPKTEKGFYLHGAFGTGKTFILLKLAQKLAKKNSKIIFAYYPDLVRHIKSNITIGGVEAIVKKLKNVDILMLDDIGGESNTAYIRDEILGPILQHRMLAMLPIFMTSNLSLADLREHLYSTKDQIDKLKSSRIIERIEYMMNEIKLTGDNYRKYLDK